MGSPVLQTHLDHTAPDHRRDLRGLKEDLYTCTPRIKPTVGDCADMLAPLVQKTRYPLMRMATATNPKPETLNSEP